MDSGFHNICMRNRDALETLLAHPWVSVFLPEILQSDDFQKDGKIELCFGDSGTILEFTSIQFRSLKVLASAMT